jgi:hypothetical protein
MIDLELIVNQVSVVKTVEVFIQDFKPMDLVGKDLKEKLHLKICCECSWEVVDLVVPHLVLYL